MLPGEGKETFFLGATDDSGVARLEYAFNSRYLGLVDLVIKADLDGLVGATRASFRIWK
jgi:hypothetical protein